MILFFACAANLKDSGQDPIDIPIVDNERSLSEVANWITNSTGYATGFATADINQDGFIDVVISYGNDMDTGPIEVYINDEGILPTSPNWTSYTNDFYGHISTGDINGDGYPDIVASRYIGSSDFSESGGIDVYINQQGVFFCNSRSTI